MRRALLITLILFVAGCIGASSPPQIDTQSAIDEQASKIGIEVGNRAPDFTVKSVDGQIIKLSDLTATGKPVIVEFGATWCPYCRADHTESSKVYGDFQDDVEFLIVGLDLTESEDLIREYRDASEFKGTFTPGNQDILTAYQVRSTTTKFAIDGNGVIRWSGSGPLSSGDWNQLFDSLRAA